MGDHLTAPEDRLQVHRLPHRPRLNVLPLQRQANVLARGAELLRVHRDAGELACAAAPGYFEYGSDPDRCSCFGNDCLSIGALQSQSRLVGGKVAVAPDDALHA